MEKLPAIFLIYVLMVLAWMVLGATVLKGTYEQDYKLKGMVKLWGTMQIQKAPSVYYQTKEKNNEYRIRQNHC